LKFNSTALNVGVTKQLSEYVTKFTFPDGRYVLSLCEGALLNMIAVGGNSPFIMSLTFASHLMAQIMISKRDQNLLKNKLCDLPTSVNEEIARLIFPLISENIYQLNNSQAEYLRKSNAK
jgi:S-adenosylhomocysteine hydrolase